ncbi:MAG TPA: ATP-binding protein [Candidatus Sulfotelmatobacter sp.]|jgi:two-component system cell cycle sensor histidine kinase/response regulator CckA|nr:ATP-binding protein [Candidatus Sulfotelmatobacter sp.]
MSTGVQKAVGVAQESPEALARLDVKVLAMVMAHAPLPQILETLCSNIETHHSGLLCSVLLLDADTKTLRHGAAPSLSREYSQAIDGTQIGPCVGSCGTAAYRRQPVIVSDIATDPLWAAYRHLALPHGLRACWSTPIASQDGGILGTFAIYYREPRTPDEEHLQLIAHATHLAAVAMEWDRAQTELRSAENRYRTLVERLPAVTYIAELGPHGRWHYVSPQIESMLGFSPADWLSDSANWIDRIHAGDRENVLAVEEHFQKNRDLFQAEYRMFARDGRVLWFRDEAVMLPTAKDQPNLMQGVMYDITERKRLEDQLLHSQKMEAVGLLAGGVAHDFNNLLMLIQAHNERLRGGLGPDAPIQKESLGIEHAVSRAASLTGRLLAFSRKQVLQPQVINLNDVLTEVAKMLERLIDKSIALRVVPGAQLWPVKADPGQVGQLIMNLAVNARDAMPQGGQLVIETTNAEINGAHLRLRDGMQPGRYVTLIVSDTGVGMDSETQAHMFEPFFTTKEPGKGTGLGLPIVYGVVKQTGGWTHVDSKPGQGTKFEIYLPCAEETETKGLASVSGLQADLAAAAKGTETILLVEDESGIRELAGEFLRRQGYMVLHAVDGDEALRIAGGHEDLIHLLVTDMAMPNLGGKELASRLRQVRPQIKVLFMSGYPDHAASADADVGGQTTLLQKPFSLDTLAQKVRTLLDQK